MKIKEFRSHGGGVGIHHDAEYRVVEWTENYPPPAGTIIVPDDTPLTDWQKRSSEPEPPADSAPRS